MWPQGDFVSREGALGTVLRVLSVPFGAECSALCRSLLHHRRSQRIAEGIKWRGNKGLLLLHFFLSADSLDPATLQDLIDLRRCAGEMKGAMGRRMEKNPEDFETFASAVILSRP